MDYRYALTFIASIALISVFSYLCGKYEERVAWNKLIAEGKLPKPTK